MFILAFLYDSFMRSHFYTLNVMRSHLHTLSVTVLNCYSPSSQFCASDSISSEIIILGVRVELQIYFSFVTIYEG